MNRWPYQPLADACREAVQDPNEHSHIGEAGYIQKAIGCTRSLPYHWKRRGYLTDQAADHAAVKLGVHPCFIWPDWFEIDMGDAA